MQSTGTSRPQPLPPDLIDPLARLAGRVRILSSTPLWFEEVGSTSDVAVSLAGRGSPEGTLVVANAQTAGRGRLGRSWASPPGAGLYVSAILYPPRPTSLLTLAAGVAVSHALLAATGLVTALKWPNDVYVGRRKLAGLLAEGGTSADGRAFVVLGIGINVLAAAYPPDVAARATSLEAELGRAVDRGIVLAELIGALDSGFVRLREDDANGLLHEWRRLAAPLLGRPVEWDEGDARLSGVARDVDDQGALLVDAGGTTRRVVGGEVRWL